MAFLAIAAASLTLSNAFVATAGWSTFGRRSRWPAWCVSGSLLLAIAVHHPGWFGVAQRVFLAAIVGWLTAAANHLRRQQRQHRY
jgi:hypothetical protein